MHRTNTPADVAATGRVQVDAGEGVTLDLPLVADPTTPQDLGTAHLDTVTAPGEYTQIYLSRANKAQGYPYDDLAGTLTIKVWNESNGSVIATYAPWSAEGIATRTFYNGFWREWLDALGNPVGTSYATSSELAALESRVAALESA